MNIFKKKKILEENILKIIKSNPNRNAYKVIYENGKIIEKIIK